MVSSPTSTRPSRSAATQKLACPSSYPRLWRNERERNLLRRNSARRRILCDLESSKRERATPGTFFVVSEQLKNDDRLTEIKSPLLDIGSHSLEHSIMTSKKIDAQRPVVERSRFSEIRAQREEAPEKDDFRKGRRGCGSLCLGTTSEA